MRSNLVGAVGLGLAEALDLLLEASDLLLHIHGFSSSLPFASFAKWSSDTICDEEKEKKTCFDVISYFLLIIYPAVMLGLALIPTISTEFIGLDQTVQH